MENRYDKYKDSGIAWIGEIPEHWKIIDLKYLSDIRGRIGFRGYTVSDLVSEGKGAFVIGGKHINQCVLNMEYPDYISWDKYYESPEIMVSKGDIVMAQRGTLGKVAIIEYDINEATINPSLVLIKNIKCQGKFLYYYLNSESTLTLISILNTATAVPMISQNQIENMPIPIPSSIEQQSIATYLDQKCSEIDELITMQEEMITKLQSYKQSVITEAVTKGLDKNVPLKDSGIEWIGEIPEHWNICKLKNIFLLSTGTTPKDFDQTSEEDNLINWYTPSDILDSCNDLFSSQRKLSEKVIYANKISLFPIGTLLYVGIGASAGKVGYANENGYSNQQITGLIPLNCYSRFYFYYLSALKDKIRDNAFFTTLPIINNAYLGQELIPFPTISEQHSIADYLDQKCSEIDELISIKQQKIEKLKDYKKSLIFECVTGKRKV